MEWNRERFINTFIQYVAVFVAAVGVCLMWFEAGDEGKALVLGGVLSVFFLITKLMRQVIKEFFAGVCTHLIAYVLYGMLVIYLIGINVFFDAGSVAVDAIHCSVWISLTIQLIYSFYIIYMRTELNDKENMSPMVVFLFIACSFIAGFSEHHMWKYVCQIGFGLFVVLQIIRWYTANVNDLKRDFRENMNFPAEQIGIVFTALELFFGLSVVMVVGVFSSGPYGNIVLYILKRLWFLILGLFENFFSDEGYTEVEITSAEFTEKLLPSESEMTEGETVITQLITEPETMRVVEVDTGWGTRLLALAALVLVAFFVAMIVYAVVDYIKKLRGSYTIGNDDFEVYEPEDNDDEEDLDVVYKDKNDMLKRRRSYSYDYGAGKSANSKKVRKIYKAGVQGKSGRSMKDVMGFPDDITYEHITDDKSRADAITATYEKARYSEHDVTDEELAEFMQNADVIDIKHKK